MVKLNSIPPGSIIDNYMRRCPYCGVPMDAATRVGGSGPVEMHEGDVTLCFYCGEVGVFTKREDGKIGIDKFDWNTLPEGQMKTSLTNAINAWKATLKRDDKHIEELKAKYPDAV